MSDSHDTAAMIRAMLDAAGITSSTPPTAAEIRAAVGVFHQRGEYERADRLVALTRNPDEVMPGVPMDPTAVQLQDMQAAFLADIEHAFTVARLPLPADGVPQRADFTRLAHRLRDMGEDELAKRIGTAGAAVAEATEKYFAERTNGAAE
ncbi:hypothetical protein [Demequina silvatica]|uniref:hypothetical protein n=1 Tax=Demequina silvatica TaxID=1638988 RepID=UPI0007807652|nr:hypothetical protein [Demequina silvatica]